MDGMKGPPTNSVNFHNCLTGFIIFEILWATKTKQQIRTSRHPKKRNNKNKKT
jgi:hypothetical protein